MTEHNRAIPELSIDTQTIERRLSEAQIGDVVTYADLTAAIGRDVQLEARGNLRTARLRLRRAFHMVFGAVPNVGVKRLDDIGKVAAARGHFAKGRTQFKHARATASAVDDFSALPNATKVEHNVLMAQSGAVLHMSNQHAAKRLEAKVGDAQRKFKPSESLALMRETI